MPDNHADSPDRPVRPATRLVRTGRARDITGQFVNPPVVHASTVLFDTVESMQERRQRYSYGRSGTPTSEALEAAVTEIEGGAGTVLAPSGLAAATTALLTCLSAGDRVLIVDSVYGPVRRFADGFLTRMGIEVVYYDGTLGAGVEALFTPNTRAIYCEAPGSLTFEMQDLPAIAEVARRHDAKVLFDNTWATPLFFQPLKFGADYSINAATKYLGGHSDLMLGTIAANEAALPALRAVHRDLGLHVGPDDMFLGLRGLRTMGVRLARHQESALAIANWLTERPEVARVLYPALPSDPGHALWKRDMTGASGLFAVVMNGWDAARTNRFVNGLNLFGIGASWGGFESLVTAPKPQTMRTATKWEAEGPVLRFHIGLEDPADLIADLDASFAASAEG